MDALVQFVTQLWPYVFAVFTVALTVVTSAHAILKKQDTAAVVAWVGVIWIAPIAGSLSYLLLGINRINRRAGLRRQSMWRFTNVEERPYAIGEYLAQVSSRDFGPLVNLGDQITRRRVLEGNRVDPLVNGDEAYPAMLAAIRDAKRSITLTSYIFNNDSVGNEFVRALATAARFGVVVRVLVDAAGARYAFPRRQIVRVLQDAGVVVARFMPARLPWKMPYMNLRSHRKILVVDGHTGFTGGMNIAANNYQDANRRKAVRDLHFRLRGPVVRHLQEVFVEDWAFTTGEVLQGEHWFPALRDKGNTLVRGINDGPDERFDRLAHIAFGALTLAQDSVKIVTPYFLPGAGLVRALTTAAMRGVQVDIVLPGRCNLLVVQWAAMATLEPLLRWGCRIWRTPQPFDHTKLMVVDGGWTLFGSANWDPRSFSLNFEFNVECYDDRLAGRMEALIQSKIACARPLSLEDVQGRALPIKLRDGVARLFSPYL